jgi:hypothetical protein
MNFMNFILGIDVGGTGIQVQLFLILSDGSLSQDAIFTWNVTTQHGLEAHVTQIADLIAAAAAEAIQQGGFLAGVGIGSPGRFREDGSIKPGSNPNMGTSPSEFDNVNLSERYRQELVARSHRTDGTLSVSLASLPLVVRNDGDAMAIGLLRAIQQNNCTFTDQYNHPVSPAHLQGKTIGYFGIGTGLGNSYCRVDFMNNIHVVNDGHLSKNITAIDREDRKKFAKVYRERSTQEGDPGMQYYEYRGRKANLESLVCNPTICALAGVDNTQDLDLENQKKHRNALKNAGKYLARGMIAVRRKMINDITPENQWTPKEIKAAKRTIIYLLGGGMMVNEPLANQLTSSIQKELKKQLGKNHGLRVVPMGCDNPSVYAAANLFLATG